MPIPCCVKVWMFPITRTLSVGMIFVGKGMKGETTQQMVFPCERRNNWGALSNGLNLNI